MDAPPDAVALNTTLPVPHLLAPVEPVMLGVKVVIIVCVPAAAAEPLTEPADIVILPDVIEFTAIVCPAVGDPANVGTMKK